MSDVAPVNPQNLAPQKPLETEEILNNFVFLVYYVNPLKDSVKLVLDDGNIKMWVKRDKFLAIISKILNESLLKECQYTLFRIRESLGKYGGLFYYDRRDNVFKELNESVSFENIRPAELFAESRRNMAVDKITQDFKGINKQYNEQIIDNTQFVQPQTRWNTFFTTIRKFTSQKKKDPIL